MFDFVTQKFSSIFKQLSGNNKLTKKNIQESLEKVQETLLEADVPFELVQSFMIELKNDVIGKDVLSALKPAEQFMKITHDRITLFMGGTPTEPFVVPAKGTIIVLGLQGSGKTTSLAKLAHWIARQESKKNKQIRIILASVDFYRPAAIDQLETLAQKIGIDFYRSSYTNPQKAAQDIFQYYNAHNFDLLLLDTAGRMHIDNPLLMELQQIDTIVQPIYKLLVLDSMTGQESLQVARAFDQGVGFHGALLTKMDSDGRGGAAFSFRYALKKPIYFIGTGEKPDQIELFRPDRMASRMLDMGDILSLVEKAEEKIAQSEQDSLSKIFDSNQFSLQDFAKQMDMVGRMGQFSQLLKYIPGASAISSDMIQKSEVEMKKFRAIISSMTMKERIKPIILDNSRKKRIASGSGVEVADVNALLNRFEESKQYVKLFKKMGGFKNFFQ